MPNALVCKPVGDPVARPIDQHTKVDAVLADTARYSTWLIMGLAAMLPAGLRIRSPSSASDCALSYHGGQPAHCGRRQRHSRSAHGRAFRMVHHRRHRSVLGELDRDPQLFETIVVTEGLAQVKMSVGRG